MAPHALLSRLADKTEAVAEANIEGNIPPSICQEALEDLNGLVDVAIAEKDHATNIFLQWFVTEQVEEEASVDAVLQKLKMVGDQGHGLFMMDRELGTRGATAAAE